MGSIICYDLSRSRFSMLILEGVAYDSILVYSLDRQDILYYYDASAWVMFYCQSHKLVQ